MRYLLLASLTLIGQAAAVYPLKQGANGRYLVDQNNTPFLLVGDSPQALIVNISEADATTFFADRVAYGINTVVIDVLCTTYTGGRADSSTFDGILPFTALIPGKSTYDLTTPNETYFAHVDRIINLAAQYGLTVILDPIETGGYLLNGTTMQDNGVANCATYGQYLGNRYKNFPNIIWMSGNDYTYPDATTSGDQYTTAVALGIQANDPTHLQTIELGAPSGSLDDPNWAPIVSLDAAYEWSPTYAQVLTEYNRSNFLPVFLVEAHYESEAVGWPTAANNTEMGTPLVLRHQEYWTMLSGATGQLYGNHYTWQFISGWQSNLDTPGSVQLGYMNALFAPRRWFDLVPDQSHSVVTAGYGTFANTGLVSANDYATVAGTADGALVMAYVPTVRTITVNMSKLGAAATARWYDPTNGTFTSIAGSPFANTGSKNFTPSGNNSAGDGDWVLVLEAAAAPTFTLQPSSQTVNAGSAAAFTATAGGLPAPTYQWQKNGTNISGATSASYNIAAVAAGDAGTYTVVATNSAGSATSNGAVLTVIVPPSNAHVTIQIN